MAVGGIPCTLVELLQTQTNVFSLYRAEVGTF